MQNDSVFTVDASNSALGAVLTQCGHPALFISRKLSPAEAKYSNIERESLAAAWACNRLKYFLLGKKFTLVTDHKPLLSIFNPNFAIKENISPRILRFALQLMQFDFEIKHIAGDRNVIADSLSRLDLSEPKTDFLDINFSEPCIALALIKAETDSDSFLQNLINRIVSGKWQNLSRWERHFRQLSQQLTVDQGCVRLGSKVVPPRALYQKVFDHAHQSHCGSQATFKLISKEFWWPNMRECIESMTRNCEVCRQHRFQAHDSTHRWPKDEQPWSRLHMDWAHTSQTGNVLILADANSGWLEAAICRNRQTTTVIDFLRAVFARFGVPNALVCDNAPEFGRELAQWTQRIGCRLIHSPEYRPQSNGLAERMVKHIKSSIKCYNPNKCTVFSYLQRVLLVHRNTAVRDGRSPAEIMLGRTTRCPILSHFKPAQSLWYRPNTSSQTRPVTFLFHENNRSVLAHDSQLSRRADDCEERRYPVRDRRPPDFYGNPLRLHFVDGRGHV